jgi:hypothetical protein
LQMGNIEAVPLIGVAADETAMPINTPPDTITASAMPDGDSMQVPLAVVFFSPKALRALQVNGDVSAPNGDLEDWIQFTTAGEIVEIEVKCPGNTLRAELWKDEKPVNNFFLSCGDKSLVTVTSNSIYFLRLAESSVNEPGYTNYILSIKSIRH